MRVIFIASLLCLALAPATAPAQMMMPQHRAPMSAPMMTPRRVFAPRPPLPRPFISRPFIPRSMTSFFPRRLAPLSSPLYASLAFSAPVMSAYAAPYAAYAAYPANPYMTPYMNPYMSMYGSSMYGSSMYGSSSMSMQTTVAAYDGYFQPATVTIRAGGTVQWTNRGTHTHTATSDSGLWDTGDMAPNTTYSWTFSAPGVYRFHCNHHPEMVGTIVVKEAGASGGY